MVDLQPPKARLGGRARKRLSNVRDTRTQRHLRALVCAPTMPEFDRESGSKRIYDFILFLRGAGWDVTFVARHAIGRQDQHVRLLEKAGVVALLAHGDDISALVQAEQFEMALLAFWQNRHVGGGADGRLHLCRVPVHRPARPAAPSIHPRRGSWSGIDPRGHDA